MAQRTLASLPLEGGFPRSPKPTAGAGLAPPLGMTPVRPPVSRSRARAFTATASAPASPLLSSPPGCSRPPVRLSSGQGCQRRRMGCRRRRVGAAVFATKQQFASFEDMLARSELPLLVDFYATWCGPCQMMSATLSSLAAKMKGRLQVVKIDTDRYPGIASKHRVQALPTIALFVGGKVVFRFEGVLSEAQLLERINHHLASTSPPSGAGPGAGADAK